MTEIYTTGTWKPSPGKEDAFVQAWAEFAAWASSSEGAGTLTLTRDRSDSERFVSFGAWESDDAVRAWKSQGEFREGLARVLQHVDDFQATELEALVTGEAGKAETVGPAAGEPAYSS
jgi:heme-degrading monooxygenase HmoA